MNTQETSGVSDFDYIRHNPTDYENFQKFSTELQKQYERSEKERRIEDRKTMLLNWLPQIPEKFRKSTMKNFNNQAASDRVMELLRNKQRVFFITGEPLTGKTTLGYAILRKLIAAGKLLPSETKTLSERELLNVAAMGFDGREKLMSYTHRQYQAYLFDNAGAKESFSPKVDMPAISSIIEAVSERSAFLFITSTLTLQEYCELLYDGSTALRLREMVADAIIEL